MDGRWRLDNDGFASARLRTDRPRRCRHRSQSRDALHRSDKIDEICNVIRPQIKYGTATMLEEKVRIRMPMLHTMAHDVACARSDAADIPTIDFAPRQLVRAAQKCVGSAPHSETPSIGKCFQFQPLLH